MRLPKRNNVIMCLTEIISCLNQVQMSHFSGLNFTDVKFTAFLCCVIFNNEYQSLAHLVGKFFKMSLWTLESKLISWKKILLD